MHTEAATNSRHVLFTMVLLRRKRAIAGHCAPVGSGVGGGVGASVGRVVGSPEPEPEPDPEGQ